MSEKEEERKELKILIVEDQEEHVLIIQNALEQSELKKRIWVCRDGEDALNYLYNQGDYASKEEYPKPDVILLDLRLPKIDGLEVLDRIKGDEGLKDIKVIVLTASEEGDDIVRAYKGDVKGYLLKSAFIVSKSGKMEELLDALISLG
ncbi:MAG: response regulator [Methanomicrobia archaeon]|nr:response regulator [Methanomicrobia archaeon]